MPCTCAFTSCVSPFGHLAIRSPPPPSDYCPVQRTKRILFLPATPSNCQWIDDEAHGSDPHWYRLGPETPVATSLGYTNTLIFDQEARGSSSQHLCVSFHLRYQLLQPGSNTQNYVNYPCRAPAPSPSCATPKPFPHEQKKWPSRAKRAP